MSVHADYLGPNRNSRFTTSSWDFVGPDNKHYMWQLNMHSPVVRSRTSSLLSFPTADYHSQLFRIDRTQATPIALFRRSKLGIVSRSRKAFLDILPAGNEIMDLVVATFVAFMEHRVLPGEIAGEHPSVLTEIRESFDPIQVANSGAIASPRSGSVPPVLPPVSPLPPRFCMAAAIARKCTPTLPPAAITFPPFAVQPKIRPI